MRIDYIGAGVGNSPRFNWAGSASDVMSFNPLESFIRVSV